jgi:hypothetical protein
VIGAVGRRGFSGTIKTRANPSATLRIPATIDKSGQGTLPRDAPLR